MKQADFPQPMGPWDWEAGPGAYQRNFGTISPEPARGRPHPDLIRYNDLRLRPMKIRQFQTASAGGHDLLLQPRHFFPRMHPSDFRVKVAWTGNRLDGDWPIDYWDAGRPFFAEKRPP